MDSGETTRLFQESRLPALHSADYCNEFDNLGFDIFSFFLNNVFEEPVTLLHAWKTELRLQNIE